jgi:hypothetical protein
MIESEILDLAESSMLWHLTNRKCHSGLSHHQIDDTNKNVGNKVVIVQMYNRHVVVSRNIPTTKLQSSVASANPDGMSCQDGRVVGNPGFGGWPSGGSETPETTKTTKMTPGRGGVLGGSKTPKITPPETPGNRIPAESP